MQSIATTPQRFPPNVIDTQDQFDDSLRFCGSRRSILIARDFGYRSPTHVVMLPGSISDGWENCICSRGPPLSIAGETGPG